MECESIIEGFVGKKVVVIGDVMIDEYIRGKVQRMSPEMPVPLLLRSRLPTLDEDLVRLGGAGNAARNVASLGAEVVLIGVSGTTDPASGQLRDLVRNHSQAASAGTPHRFAIDCRIVPQADLFTTHKLRMLSDQSVQLFRVDTEDYQVLSPETIDAVREAFREAAAWCDVVLVSDYAKGLITAEMFRELRAICPDKPIVVDPKEVKDTQRLAKYQGADIVVPNEAELRKSFAWRDLDEPLETYFAGRVQNTLRSLKVKAIVCTRGPKGILFSDFVSDNGLSVVGGKVEVADVTGASDTVIATVALSCAQGASLPLTARIAEAAGRIKVTKRLTGTVYMKELLETLDPMFQKRASAKLHLDPTALSLALAELKRAKGKDARVALVTGCFDILHCGHVRLLELAAEAADVVLVAVNSDDYVRRAPHKIGGPYVDELSRATLIASLASVDLATIFDEDTPEAVITATEPNILVMGQEYEQAYREGWLPAMAEIQRLGAEVKFAEWQATRGLSSSAIAQRIRAS